MKNFEDLEKVSEINFLRAQEKLRPILVRESKVRNQLAKLDSQDRSSTAENGHAMSVIGADALWKVWLGRTRSELNYELARILAEKERMLAAVNKSYGKLLVSSKLAANHRVTLKRQHEKAMLQEVVEAFAVKDEPNQ
jgi:hypothetical protein